MAPKKRPKTPVLKKSTLEESPTVLTQDAIFDLHFIEPARARDRVIAALNEAFLRILTLERLHAEPTPPPPKKKRQ